MTLTEHDLRPHLGDSRHAPVPRRLPHGPPIPDRLVPRTLAIVERLLLLAVYTRRARRLVPRSRRDALSARATDILDVARILRRHALDTRGGRGPRVPRIGPMTHEEIREGLGRNAAKTLHGLRRLRRELADAGCAEVAVFVRCAGESLDDAY